MTTPLTEKIFNYLELSLRDGSEIQIEKRIQRLHNIVICPCSFRLVLKHGRWFIDPAAGKAMAADVDHNGAKTFWSHIATQPVRTLFLFKSIWTRPQGSQGCQKIRIFFSQLKVLSSCPFGSQNIKNRVFRFELFSVHLPLWYVVNYVLTSKSMTILSKHATALDGRKSDRQTDKSSICRGCRRHGAV